MTELDEDVELHIVTAALGFYPYILIQFEPVGLGHWRIGVDYDLLTEEEVRDILEEIVQDMEARRG